MWAQQESELLWYPDAFRDNVSAELGVLWFGHNKRVNSYGTQMPSETMSLRNYVHYAKIGLYFQRIKENYN
jgi:hypothetical protein